MRIVDLRSDTLTSPSAPMREAIAAAEVGDDVYGEDPTVNALQEAAAALLGKEAALFVASGTMANQVAVLAHTRPGDSVIVGRNAHVHLYEGGGMAALSGVQAVEIEHELITADEVREAIYVRDSHFPNTRLVCLENTHNRAGGRVFPLAEQQAVAELARKRGLAMHLDGARMFNASVALGCEPAEVAAPFDSISFCLSKGLGAPVGSLVVGSRDFVAEAHRSRKRLGGGMRQAGILAAAGMYALSHNVKRLADDHANASRLASGLREISSVEMNQEPETNIVLFRVPDVAGVLSQARERGVRLSAIDGRTIRAVTHLDVSTGDVDHALEILSEICA